MKPSQRLVPTLLLLALALAALLPAAAAASWPGANGPVVYVGLDPVPEPLTSIVRYHATGLRSFVPGVPASVSQLTTDPTDRDPKASADGRQIAFQCRHFRRGLEYSWEHICSVRPDGSHRRDLTPGFKDGQPATDPDFSPLGRVIAFSVGPGTAADVFFAPAGGGLIAVARSGSKPRFVLIQPSIPNHPQELEASILGRSPTWAPAPR